MKPVPEPLNLEGSSRKKASLTWVGAGNNFVAISLYALPLLEKAPEMKKKAVRPLHPVNTSTLIMSDQVPNLLQRESGITQAIPN